MPFAGARLSLKLGHVAIATGGMTLSDGADKKNGKDHIRAVALQRREWLCPQS